MMFVAEGKTKMTKGNLMALLSVALSSCCCPPVGEENFAKDGFVSLFNGKDLSGWKIPEGDKGHWLVIDGAIDYDAQSEAKDKTLWTEETFGNYELHIDWRFKSTAGLFPAPTILPDGNYKTDADGKQITTLVPNADSGIYLRGDSGDDPTYGGRSIDQLNLWCVPVGSGELFWVRHTKENAPEIRAAATPKVRADNPPRHWNSMDINLTDDRVTVVLNGKTVIENAQIPGISKEGPIGLQHHGGIHEVTGNLLPHSSLVEFRNIWIKRLDR